MHLQVSKLCEKDQVGKNIQQSNFLFRCIHLFIFIFFLISIYSFNSNEYWLNMSLCLHLISTFSMYFLFSVFSSFKAIVFSLNEKNFYTIQTGKIIRKSRWNLSLFSWNQILFRIFMIFFLINCFPLSADSELQD